jgi:hypothetical protein
MDDGQQAIRKAHLRFQLRWAKNLFLTIKIPFDKYCKHKKLKNKVLKVLLNKHTAILNNIVQDGFSWLCLTLNGRILADPTYIQYLPGCLREIFMAVLNIKQNKRLQSTVQMATFNRAKKNQQQNSVYIDRTVYILLITCYLCTEGLKIRSNSTIMSKLKTDTSSIGPSQQEVMVMG